MAGEESSRERTGAIGDNIAEIQACQRLLGDIGIRIFAISGGLEPDMSDDRVQTLHRLGLATANKLTELREQQPDSINNN